MNAEFHGAMAVDLGHQLICIYRVIDEPFPPAPFSKTSTVCWLEDSEHIREVIFKTELEETTFALFAIFRAHLTTPFPKDWRVAPNGQESSHL